MLFSVYIETCGEWAVKTDPDDLEETKLICSKT